jgi:hypothetical protein
MAGANGKMSGFSREERRNLSRNQLKSNIKSSERPIER